MCYPNLQSSCAQPFQLRNYFRAQHFRKCWCLQGFQFHISLIIPRQDLVGEIQLIADKVEDAAVACTVSIWDYGSNGSIWVQPSVVINIPPRSSILDISTTIQTPEEELVPINVSPTGRLVGLEDD